MSGVIASPIAFFSTLCFFAVGSIGSLLFSRRDSVAAIWANVFAVLGSLASLIFAVNSLVTGKIVSFSYASNFSILSFTFRIDALSAFFVGLIGLIALMASIYAFGYLKHYYQRYNLGVLGFFYNVFLASLILVAAAHNAIFFLLAWETMSLASFFLVIYEHREETNVAAGTLYLIMTHIGTAFIFFAFLLLYKATGTFDFSAMRAGLASSSSVVKGMIFLSALFGFGAKAGIIPLHIWLPSAHPAAPSHVSAIMSGVMIKTGIYMLIRICFFIMPSVPLWWGVVVLLLGAVSSLLGVLYALSEHDLKRLLAFHSIENIGIILLGLGSAMIFLSFGLPGLATIGLVAALYHTMNHATFKALLFLGAGAVISATHTRNIEEYGGLIKRMPQTALFFLIGAMAISALPPFNGFFSEWLTFQAMFQGVVTAGVFTKAVFITAIGSLAFTGGLAAACFVKAFGVTFLGRPRSIKAGNAPEVSGSMRISMAVLSLLTLAFGFFSGMISSILKNIALSLPNLESADTTTVMHITFSAVTAVFATISMPSILLFLAVGIMVAAVLTVFVSRRQKIIRNITWDCGTNLTPRMEITATGFSRSIITIFQGILKPTKQMDVEYHDSELRYFPKIGVVHLGLTDVYERYFYRPAAHFFLKISEQVKKIQNGNINAYVSYVFITLIVLLIAFAI